MIGLADYSLACSGPEQQIEFIWDRSNDNKKKITDSLIDYETINGRVYKDEREIQEYNNIISLCPN